MRHLTVQTATTSGHCPTYATLRTPGGRRGGPRLHGSRSNQLFRSASGPEYSRQYATQSSSRDAGDIGCVYNCFMRTETLNADSYFLYW